MADHDAPSEPEPAAGRVGASRRRDEVRPPAGATPQATPSSLGAHSVVYLVGTALQGLGVLLVLPFATRLLGPAEFGRVATGLVVVQMVGTLAAAGLPQVILREHHRGAEGPRAARALAGTMILLALALAVLGLLSGDVLLTRWLVGASEAGEYQVALQIGNIPFVLAVALFNAWGPLVLSRPTQDRWAWTRRSGTALLSVVVVGAGLVAGTSYWISYVLAGPDFEIAAIGSTAALLTLVSVIYMLYQGSSLAVLDSERTGWLAAGALAGLAVMVALAVALAPVGSIMGVALAKIAGYLTLTVVTVVAGRRDLRWPKQAWLALGVAVVATALSLNPVSGVVAVVLMLVGAVVVGPTALRVLRR